MVYGHERTAKTGQNDTKTGKQRRTQHEREQGERIRERILGKGSEAFGIHR